MSSYTLEIVGSIANAQKEFAKIPGFTEQSAARAAQAWAKNQEKMRREAEKTADRIAKEMGNASKESGKKLDALQKVGEKTFGGMVGDVADVGGALMALGPIGGTVVASLLAIGGAAVSIGAATAAMIQLQRSSLDFIEEIEKIKGLDFIDKGQKDQIIEANAALDALVVIAKKLAIDLAAELAPTIVATASYLGELGLEAIESAQAFYAARDATEEFVIFLAESLMRTLTGPLATLNDFAHATNELAKVFGHGSIEIEVLTTNIDRMYRSVAENVTGMDGLADATSEATGEQSEFDRLLQTMAKHIREDSKEKQHNKDRTKELAEQIERQGDAYRRLIDMQQELGEDQLTGFDKAAREAHKFYQRQVDAAYEAFEKTAMGERELAALQMTLAEATARFRRDMDAAELADLERQSEAATAIIERRYADELALMEAQKAERERATAEEMAMEAEAAAEWQKVFDEGTRLLFDKAADVHETMMDEKRANIEYIEDRLENEKGLTLHERQELQTRLEQEKASARNTAKIQRGLAAFEILLSNAVAMAKAIATAGPGLNVPAIAAQAALTALYTAAALAAPLPKFHSGSGRLMPDEQPAVLKRGEAVLSERAVQEMNRGSAPGGGGNVQQIFWNGRLMSEVVGMAMAQPGPARRFVEARLPTGRGYRG